MNLGSGNDLVVVDDDEVDLYIIKRYYEKSGYKNKLRTFSDPKAFLHFMKMVDEQDMSIPDLVLLDINMHLMSGFEVLKEIKANSKFAKTPQVCIFSNSDRPEDKQKSFKLGAKHFIEKSVMIRGNIFKELQVLIG